MKKTFEFLRDRIAPPVVIALVCAASASAQAAAVTARRSMEVGRPILESHSYKEFSAVPQVWTILQDAAA